MSHREALGFAIRTAASQSRTGKSNCEEKATYLLQMRAQFVYRQDDDLRDFRIGLDWEASITARFLS